MRLGYKWDSILLMYYSSLLATIEGDCILFMEKELNVTINNLLNVQISNQTFCEYSFIISNNFE